MSASTITHESFLKPNPNQSIALREVFKKALDNDEPPRLCFKMKKYFVVGKPYIDGMRMIIDTMYQEHGVEKWYLDISFDTIEVDSLKAKNAEPINEIFETLERIETCFKHKGK
jgi:hypothetical protein